MAVIHCMCGYIGFGKTTVAKQLEIQYGAKRFTPDEVMIELIFVCFVFFRFIRSRYSVWL